MMPRNIDLVVDEVILTHRITYLPVIDPIIMSIEAPGNILSLTCCKLSVDQTFLGNHWPAPFS